MRNAAWSVITCVFGHTLYPLIAIAGMATGNVCEKMRRSYDIPGPGDRYNTNIDGYIYTYIIQCKTLFHVYSAKVTIRFLRVFCVNLSMLGGEYLSV